MKNLFTLVIFMIISVNVQHGLNSCSAWYLPSKDELNKLFKNRVPIGSFAYNYYWSSLEYDNGSAWVKFFNLGL